MQLAARILRGRLDRRPDSTSVKGSVSEQLDSWRAQIPEWPTNTSRIYNELLDELCSRNPGKERTWIESHQQAKATLDKAEPIARQQDDHYVEHISTALLKSTKQRAVRATLEPAVRHWLDTGSKGDLENMMVEAIMAPHLQAYETLQSEVMQVRTGFRVSAQTLRLDGRQQGNTPKSNCRMVPAAMVNRAESMVYGGVSLAFSTLESTTLGPRDLEVRREFFVNTAQGITCLVGQATVDNTTTTTTAAAAASAGAAKPQQQGGGSSCGSGEICAAAWNTSMGCTMQQCVTRLAKSLCGGAALGLYSAKSMSFQESWEGVRAESDHAAQAILGGGLVVFVSAVTAPYHALVSAGAVLGAVGALDALYRGDLRCRNA